MKYMGSKSRIAKYIVPIIQKYINDNQSRSYIEPFMGGCNVIDKIVCKNRIANDNNLYLVELFKGLLRGEKLPNDVPKDMYDVAREQFYTGIKDYSFFEIGAIGFLASYNGRFFDGGYAKAGYEKTNKGQRYRDYYEESKKNILNQISKLTDVYFYCLDYKELMIPVNSVIYCDPPYKGTKQFHNSNNFNYTEFWNIMRDWSQYNTVLISELKAPSDFECIWEQDVLRSIKSKDKSRATEKLFIKR